MSRCGKEIAVLALALALPLAACRDTTGLDDGSGTARVMLASSSPGSAAVLASLVASAFDGPVDPSVVASLEVTLTQVQATRVPGDEEEPGGWVTLELTAPEVIDLMALPAAGLEVAYGEVPAGEYYNVRLRFSEAWITFSEEVTLGTGPAAQTYAADEPHPVFIPSGDQTGIKIPLAGFVIEDGEGDTVVLEFDESTTVQNILVTGTGILVTPVLYQTQE